MATIDVKDAAGSTVEIEKPLAPGRAAAATSRPVVLSTEDAAKVPALGRAAASASTPIALSTEDAAKVPALGQATKAASVPVAIASDQALTVSLQPTTSGGSSIFRNLDLGVTGQVVKASAGQIYNYFISNVASSPRFVKVYDKATAPTQADTPVMTFCIPAGSAANVAFPNGVAFANGISLRATTAVADNDTGAPAANDVVVNIGYK